MGHFCLILTAAFDWQQPKWEWLRFPEVYHIKLGLRNPCKPHHQACWLWCKSQPDQVRISQGQKYLQLLEWVLGLGFLCWASGIAKVLVVGIVGGGLQFVSFLSHLILGQMTSLLELLKQFKENKLVYSQSGFSEVLRIVRFWQWPAHKQGRWQKRKIVGVVFVGSLLHRDKVPETASALLMLLRSMALGLFNLFVTARYWGPQSICKER